MASFASVSCLRSHGFVVLLGDEDRDAKERARRAIGSQPPYKLRAARFLSSQSQAESVLGRVGWRDEFRGKYYISYANGPIFFGVIESPSMIDTDEKMVTLLLRLDQQAEEQRVRMESPWRLEFDSRGVEVLCSVREVSTFERRVASGRFGAVRCRTRESAVLLARMTAEGMEGFTEDDGMWLLVFGMEPTVACLLVDGDRGNLGEVMEGMVERHRRRRVFLPLRVRLPEGNEVRSTLPFRADVEDLLAGGGVDEALLVRVQKQWGRLRSLYDISLSGFCCSVCNSTALQGVSHETVRVVNGSAEVGVRRLCPPCSDALPPAVVCSNGQLAVRATYRDDLEAARRRAEVRVAAEGGSAASLLFAMERYLDVCLPADAEDFLSAARKLADLVRASPHVARGATSLLSRIPFAQCLPRSEGTGRVCSACGERKEVGEFTKNQWRSARRRRCKMCQSVGMPRRGERLEVDLDDEVSGFQKMSMQEQQAEDEEERENECAVCFQEAPDQLYLHPPSHHWTCKSCFDDLVRHGHACPFCREIMSA